MDKFVALLKNIYKFASKHKIQLILPSCIYWLIPSKAEMKNLFAPGLFYENIFIILYQLYLTFRNMATELNQARK